nr:hypothetical protein mv_L189 [Moumouvirus Monve]
MTLENIEKSMYNGILNRLESIEIKIQIRPRYRTIIIYTTQDNKIWNNPEEYIDVIVKHFIIGIDNTVKLLEDHSRVKN